MEWIIPLTAFIVGLVLGYVAHTLMVRKDQAKETAIRAEQAEIELSQYKQSVEDLYMEQGRALALVTEQLNQANQRWNDAATHLQFSQNPSLLPTLSNKASAIEGNSLVLTEIEQMDDLEALIAQEQLELDAEESQKSTAKDQQLADKKSSTDEKTS